MLTCSEEQSYVGLEYSLPLPSIQYTSKSNDKTTHWHANLYDKRALLRVERSFRQLCTPNSIPIRRLSLCDMSMGIFVDRYNDPYKNNNDKKLYWKICIVFLQNLVINVSFYCHHQIGNINLPIVVIFSVAVCLRWFYHHMLSVSYISLESWVLCLSLRCSLMMCANNRVHYEPMAVFVCLYITLPRYYHHGDLSDGIGLPKCLLGTFCLKCVFKIKKISSIIFNAINGDMRFQLTHSCYDCENACTLCYYHHQIGSMTHLALFRVKSWNNGMRFMSFYIFTYSQDHDIKHITKIKLC